MAFNPNRPVEIVFIPNQLVEIIHNTGEGFSSGISYYTATVLARTRRNRYSVLYHTRFNSGRTRFTEEVDSDEIRPWYQYSRHFNLGIAVSDMVEAYLFHAWRVGTVIGIDHGQIYRVKLPSDESVSHCHISKLRRHLTWRNGSWFSVQTRSQSNQASTSAQGGLPATGGDRVCTSLQLGPPGLQASTSLLGGQLQLGNHTSTLPQGDQPYYQASTLPRWDQPNNQATTLPQGGQLGNRASTSLLWKQPNNQATTLPQGGQLGNRASTSLLWKQPNNQASTLPQGGQPGNQASTSLLRVQPNYQASTLPQWDQPEDDGSQAKRRRRE